MLYCTLNWFTSTAAVVRPMYHPLVVIVVFVVVVFVIVVVVFVVVVVVVVASLLLLLLLYLHTKWLTAQYSIQTRGRLRKPKKRHMTKS